MKKFKILGVFSILVIIVYIIGSLGDFTQGVSDGWNDADKLMADSISINPTETTWGRITVRPTSDSEWGEAFNSAFGKDIPYKVNSITTYVVPSRWYFIIEMLVFPIAIAFLYGFYCLVNFMFSVTRYQIFTEKNVFRIRWFSYSYIALQLQMLVLYWLSEQAALAQVTLPGYELVGDTFIEADWISMILIILFTEIFAMGTKIKEEQDLTI